MKFLVFSLIVTACAASVHFRDLPVYTSGYLVTKIYPSETQCEGIPSRFFEPIGKCRADEEGSYIITKLAQSTITSYFDQTIVRYPDSSCSTTNSSIIKTLTTKLLKTCTEGDSSTGAFQFSYRAELPKEDTGILVKGYNTVGDCTSYSNNYDAVMYEQGACVWMGDGKYGRVVGCSTYGYYYPSVVISYNVYAESDCSGDEYTVDSISHLSCDGNNDMVSMTTCLGGNFHIASPTFSPSWVPTSYPTNGTYLGVNETWTPTETPTPIPTTPTEAPTVVPTYEPTYSPTHRSINATTAKTTGYLVDSLHYENCTEVGSWRITQLGVCVQNNDPDASYKSFKYYSYDPETKELIHSVYEDSECEHFVEGACPDNECVTEQNTGCKDDYIHNHVISWSATYPSYADSVSMAYYETYDECSHHSGDTSLIAVGEIAEGNECIQNPFGDNNTYVKLSYCSLKYFTEEIYADDECTVAVESFNQPMYLCSKSIHGYVRVSCNYEPQSAKDARDKNDQHNDNKAPKDAIYTLLLLFLLVPAIVFMALKFCHKEEPIKEEPMVNSETA